MKKFLTLLLLLPSFLIAGEFETGEYEVLVTFGSSTFKDHLKVTEKNRYQLWMGPTTSFPDNVCFGMEMYNIAGEFTSGNRFTEEIANGSCLGYARRRDQAGHFKTVEIVFFQFVVDEGRGPENYEFTAEVQVDANGIIILENGEVVKDGGIVGTFVGRRL